MPLDVVVEKLLDGFFPDGVKMLPEALTLGRLIVPFDIISRTMMVAIANPFDAVGKEAVQQLLDYNIQWHLASPSAILQVLQTTYRLD